MDAIFYTACSNANSARKLFISFDKINRGNFFPWGPIKNIPALVQIMAVCRPGDRPLSEPLIVSLSTHICVTRLQ